MNTHNGLYIGLMSGTSVDAIDAALIEFTGSRYQLIETHNIDYPSQLQTELKQLMRAGHCSLDVLGQLDRAVGQCFAQTVQTLLTKSGKAAHDIIAIGSHGQTIRHLPPADGVTHPFSTQIGDASTIAALTGIDVIADFRQADMCHGGHGAPLAPGFHQYAFSLSEQTAVLNLGGIANITLVDKNQVLAWDTGPASGLMDNWTLRHLGSNYDDKGRWAAGGNVNKPLLDQLKSLPYFAAAPPKSTGFEVFNINWLERELAALELTPNPQDTQATLLELTAQTIADAIAPFKAETLYVCGGGAYNDALMLRLSTLVKPRTVATTAVLGLQPDWVEACAFAWLAYQYKNGLPGNIASVTGATSNVVLGGLYRGSKRLNS